MKTNVIHVSVSTLRIHVAFGQNLINVTVFNVKFSKLHNMYFLINKCDAHYIFLGCLI